MFFIGTARYLSCGSSLFRIVEIEMESVSWKMLATPMLYLYNVFGSIPIVYPCVCVCVKPPHNSDETLENEPYMNPSPLAIRDGVARNANAITIIAILHIPNEHITIAVCILSSSTISESIRKHQRRLHNSYYPILCCCRCFDRDSECGKRYERVKTISSKDKIVCGMH